eukprot:170669-Rhodomonas_salina.1
MESADFCHSRSGQVLHGRWIGAHQRTRRRVSFLFQHDRSCFRAVADCKNAADHADHGSRTCRDDCPCKGFARIGCLHHFSATADAAHTRVFSESSKAALRLGDLSLLLGVLANESATRLVVLAASQHLTISPAHQHIELYADSLLNR